MNNEMISIKNLAQMIAQEVSNEKTSSSITFEDGYNIVILRMQSRGNAKNSIRNYKHSMKKFLAFLIYIKKEKNLELVTSEDLEDFLIEIRKKNYQPRSFNKIVQYVKQLFKILLMKKKITDDPSIDLANDVVIKKRMRVLTLCEIKSVLNSFDMTKLTHQMGLAMFSVQTDIGCRVSELSRLKVENINFSTLEIKYIAYKNKVEVITPISELSAVILKTYIKAVLKDKKQGYLFLTTTNSGRNITFKQISEPGVRTIYRLAGERAGLKFTLNTHMIRRTVITKHIENGGSITTAKELVGHKDIRSTMGYVYFSQETLHQAHNEFGLHAQIKRGLAENE